MHRKERLQTFQGIDTCGDRLASEILQLVRQHHGLQYISLIGHSMGGLIVRYAAGRLFDAQHGTIAGLTPAHFLTMASPHLGCSTVGEAQVGTFTVLPQPFFVHLRLRRIRLRRVQVPLIAWMGQGSRLQHIAGALAPRMTTLLCHRTGRQLFLTDAALPSGQTFGSQPPQPAAASCSQPQPEQVPLVVQLAFDVEGGLQFRSALAAFRSRTCYANADGDHLVGWANSSLRAASALPTFDAHAPGASKTGVVHADAVAAAFAASSGNASLEAETVVAGSDATNAMLSSLQGLPWARVDCSWRGARVGVFAHNHIQVTRGWLNYEVCASV